MIFKCEGRLLFKTHLDALKLPIDLCPVTSKSRQGLPGVLDSSFADEPVGRLKLVNENFRVTRYWNKMMAKENTIKGMNGNI